MTEGIRCMLMRGGTSKGAYFLSADLPSDPALRDDILLRVMGSPDVRQIDGLGGAHPLTSKVAVISPSADPDADVDYLFLQVVPDQAIVTDRQACGNMLAGVGPFAIERGLVAASDETTTVRIRMLNPTIALVNAHVQTPGGVVDYDGATLMAGAPFPAAAIPLDFIGDDRSIFPTGNLTDTFDGATVTCVDAGMPVVIIDAETVGVRGDETPAELEADDKLTARIESIRLQAGPAMGLGDVTGSTVPKLSIISNPRDGGLVSTRTFIPRRVHEAIGVLGAVSVAASVLTPGTVCARPSAAGGLHLVEHPSGALEVGVELRGSGVDTAIASSRLVRTTRKIMDGIVWPRATDQHRSTAT